MLVNDKEQKINEKIQEITCASKDINQQASYDLVRDYREYKIKKMNLNESPGISRKPTGISMDLLILFHMISVHRFELLVGSLKYCSMKIRMELMIR